MWWRSLDLILANLVSWGLLGLLEIVSSRPLQSAVGLVAVLFCPGYALTAALYPGRGELGPIQRVALSAGLSVALAALLGLALYFTPWNAQPTGSALALSLTVTGLSAVAVFRRRRLSPSQPSGRSGPHVDAKSVLRWAVLLSAVVVIAVPFGLAAYRLQESAPPEPLTEFFVLDSQGGTDRYSAVLNVGEPATYTVVVVNREGQAIRYRLRTLLDRQEEADSGPLALKDNERQEVLVSLTPHNPTERAKLEFLLFRDGYSSPYRKAGLWVKVQPAPALP